MRASVDEAGFFDLPGDSPASPGAGGADRFAYTVTVEDERRSHTVRRSDSDLPAGLRALIDLVRALGGTDAHLEPPG